MTDPHLGQLRSSKLLAYAQLLRLPNVFTAAADVTMGVLFVGGPASVFGPFPWLLGASCLLYMAGVVLNDVYDFHQDARLRPHRPLPSGRIARAWAMRLGYAMLAVGVALGWLAGWAHRPPAALAWRSGVMALLTASCVILYDAWLKNTIVGPWAMGTCRCLNVLLGMSAAAHVGAGGWRWLGYEPAQLMVAGGVGVYIAGVTWFARGEVEGGGRPRLLFGFGVMMAGLALLALLPHWRPELTLRLEAPLVVWPLMLACLAAPIARRCLGAVLDPAPRRVQESVKLCILSLIVLDAEICLLANDPAGALAVVILLAPAVLLGQWVYST